MSAAQTVTFRHGDARLIVYAGRRPRNSRQTTHGRMRFSSSSGCRSAEHQQGMGGAGSLSPPGGLWGLPPVSDALEDGPAARLELVVGQVAAAAKLVEATDLA